MPFGIFSSRALLRANAGAVTLFGSYISFQFLVTQYLQTLSGWSALATALAFLPAGVMVVLLSIRMARCSAASARRRSPRSPSAA